MSLIGLSNGLSSSLSVKTKRYADNWLKLMNGTLEELIDYDTVFIAHGPLGVTSQVVSTVAPNLRNVAFYAAEEVDARAFQQQAKLLTAYLPKVRTFRVQKSGTGSYAFQACTSLLKVYLPVVEELPNYIFAGCTSLVELNLSRVSSVPPLGTGALPSTVSDGLKIVVPDALVEDFKTATNWSTYASRIVGVSEYDSANGGS